MTDPFEQLAAGPTTDSPDAGFAANLRSRVESIEARGASPLVARWHLAQLNLGLFRAPLESPEMADFANALDRINAIAEASPGFVWRLTDDAGASSSFVEVPGADDPLIAPNLSVWTDLESLREFMYKTDHAAYLRRRAEWFQRESHAMTVGWWVPAGTIPTLADAVRRLEHLREHGPSDEGFPLTRRIPDPPEWAPHGGAETGKRAQVFVPYLTVGDARAALDFYGEVFAAVPDGEVVDMDDGRLGHAEMLVAGQRFCLADEFPEMNLRAPETVGSNSVSIVVLVDDCDAVFAAAVAAGATSERPPADQHGERSGWFVDPWGHRWCPTSPERAEPA